MINEMLLLGVCCVGVISVLKFRSLKKNKNIAAISEASIIDSYLDLIDSDGEYLERVSQEVEIIDMMRENRAQRNGGLSIVRSVGQVVEITKAG